MQCVPCPDGAYQVTSNRANYCTRCTRCEEVVMNHWVSAILSQCTAISNTVCGCILGYHFTKDQRELERGFCQTNSLCSAGHGLVANASSFTDTQCKPCTNGTSYNPAQSLDPCHQCTTSCPNNTEMWHPCNTTHNMACIPDREMMHVVVESDSSTYLKAGMGSCVGFMVVLCSICFIKRRRQGTEKNDQSRQDISSILENIRKICLRSALTGSERGQDTVNEAKESFDREKYHSRLFHALTIWKQCCYRGNDTVMYEILCYAVNTHTTNVHFRRS
ncbi:unnamed protein product [Mytilus edulis]|uniref:TNFR-Cys domain-containing protein n=1 Tax=Mytilus edulis TaxID=6550 RepID=A0A8S3Q0C3_MYTED|nr:unnamed protein product [Mytilus edulis]